MTLVWSHEQRVVIAEIAAKPRPRSPDSCPACLAGIPTHTVTYAPREIELARQAAVRERVHRRQRLARQLTVAIGWHAP